MVVKRNVLTIVDEMAILAWISYLNISLLLGTMAITLFNASRDPIATRFAYTYAAISIGILVSTRLHPPRSSRTHMRRRCMAIYFSNVGSL